MTTDPLMVFYKTKDIAACVANFDRLIAEKPERAVDPHSIRIAAGFFYEAMEAGSIPKTFIRDTILTEEVVAEGRVSVSEARFDPDKVGTEENRAAEELSQSPLAFWSAVQGVLDAYQGKETVEDKVNSGWDLMSKSPLTQGADLSSIEADVKTMLRKMFDRQPSKLLDIERFTQPGYNDLCYIGFGATGDRRYIERVVKVLDQGPGQDAMGSMVVLTAAWSLRSLTTQYTDILEVVESIPGAVEKIEGVLERFE